ncbi:sulfite exporter TauE/SafE family protein [Candidatus Bipolaricaulota bacterium]|nr:sulfite exporter TauE/SafE family protein [Candidatus Bipolaricaulota bacterium]
MGTYFLLFGAGLGIGTVASMIGVGGGVFMVPLLALSGLVATTQEAVGTSIAGVIFTSLSSSIAYFRRRGINVGLGLAIMPGALGGALLGAWASGRITSGWLAVAFGVFLLYPAVVMLMGKQPKELFRRERDGGHPILATLVGFVAGFVSGLFGLGGGTVMVPALILTLGLDIRQAAATSLFVMIPSAALATSQHALAGNTHWELALPLIGGIVIGAQLGPALGGRLPRERLRQLFALVLLYAAVNMVLKGLGLR